MNKIIIISSFLMCFKSMGLTYEEGLEQLRQKSIDLQQARLESSSSESDLSSAKMKLLPKLSANMQYEKTKSDSESVSDKASYLEMAGELSIGAKEFQEIKKNQLILELKKKTEFLKKESIESLYFFNFQKLMGMRKMRETIANSRKRLSELKSRIEKGRKSGQVSERIFIDLDLREEELKLQELTLKQEENEAKSDLSNLLNEESLNFTGKLRHFHVSFNDLQIKESKEAQIAKLTASISNTEKKIQLSELMPKLQYGIEYGRLIEDDRINEGDSEARVFVGVKIPLFDGENIYKYKSSKELEQIGQLEKQKAALSSKAKMQNLKDRISFLDSEVHIVAKKIALNKKKFKLSLGDVRFGQVSFFEVLENEKELYELEKREISAIIEMSSHVYTFEEDFGISLKKVFN